MKAVKIINGKGFRECATCVNRECDPFQCEKCVNGSKWECEDDSEELTIHDLKSIRFEGDV